jgi:hypothetical protein
MSHPISPEQVFTILKWVLVLCPTSKLQNDCHSRVGGSPAIVPAKAGIQTKIDFLDSRLRGNDEWIARLRTENYF